jgi:hypothetical protein
VSIGIACTFFRLTIPQKLHLSFWDELIKEYFTPKASVNVTLWKDNQGVEAKQFGSFTYLAFVLFLILIFFWAPFSVCSEIGVPILPRFFLVTTQSGVKSMTLALDGARERIVTQGHLMVECIAAVWTYNYANGYAVTLRGPLICHIVLAPNPSQLAPQHVTFKFDSLQFNAKHHEKYIALDAIIDRDLGSPNTPRLRVANPPLSGSSQQLLLREEDKKWEEPMIVHERVAIPGEPVNAFGIPQATMRCLEVNSRFTLPPSGTQLTMAFSWQRASPR